MEISDKPTLGFFEWLERMKAHSCPHCEHWWALRNLKEENYPINCIECYAGYS